ASLATYLKYSSELTTDSQEYNNLCDRSYFYYETLRVTVSTDGYYVFSTNKRQKEDMYLYKNHFNPLDPHQNLLLSMEPVHFCVAWNHEAAGTHKLQSHITYILVVTTNQPLTTQAFSISLYGPTNFTLQRFIDNSTYCYVGGPCNTQVKGIGLTLDDILRLEVNRNMSIQDQPLSIKISGALSVIMFVVSVVSSLCSFLTFQNQKSRTVGCGLYFLTSSVTSFLTITMFTVKFWFVVGTQISPFVRQSALQVGCKSIECLLKLFFCWDAWLSACAAVERSASVYKGVRFDKEKSKRFARWIIFTLPVLIMGSLIHEPIYRQISKHETMEKTKNNVGIIPTTEIVTHSYAWCVTTYPQSVQDYNTVILFVHLLGPFLTNLFSSVFIIIASARRRAEAQNRQPYREHLREQWSEHKQLVISPLVLLLLSTPRLVISLLSGCTDVSRYAWLYISAYFISFTPSILIFVIFVLPSTSYRSTFKQSLFRLCKRSRS
ncbi:unnamed protein product, partial [Adineta ricciae]